MVDFFSFNKNHQLEASRHSLNVPLARENWNSTGKELLKWNQFSVSIIVMLTHHNIFILSTKAVISEAGK